MITLTDKIPKTHKNADVCFARINCQFKAYSAYNNIALFWKQTKGNKITAYFSLFGGCLTVFDNGADFEEIKSFVSLISPETVFATEYAAEKLNLNITDVCFAFLHKTEKQLLLPENTLEGVYALSEKISNNFANTKKDELYVDLSHLARHNCLHYVTSNKAAAVMQISDNYGIVTGLCVDEGCRNKGMGSAVLAKLLTGVRNKKIYAVCNENLINFYTVNGFENTGKYCICKGKF